MTPIAMQLRQRRQELGLTQADVAKKIGTTRGVINIWEVGGHAPNAVMLTYWAEALGVTIEIRRRSYTTQELMDVYGTRSGGDQS